MAASGTTRPLRTSTTRALRMHSHALCAQRRPHRRQDGDGCGLSVRYPAVQRPLEPATPACAWIATAPSTRSIARLRRLPPSRFARYLEGLTAHLFTGKLGAGVQARRERQHLRRHRHFANSRRVARTSRWQLRAPPDASTDAAMQRPEPGSAEGDEPRDRHQVGSAGQPAGGAPPRLSTRATRTTWRSQTRPARVTQ